MNQTKIAITGANGYIGSFLAKHLAAEGYSIVKMLRETKGEKDSIAYSLDKVLETNALSNIDVLIHCAYDFSLTDPDEIEEVNVKGSVNLLNQAKREGVKKIIYLSSTSAFESASSDYGKAKFSIEKQVRDKGIIIVRPGLVFNKNAGGIIGSISKLISKLHIAPLISNGKQLFFPCHLEDLSKLISALSLNDYDIQTPIVAASEQAISFKNLIKTIAESMNKTALLIPIPYSFIFITLKLTEILGLKIGLRSDSLKYMKNYNKKPDFSSAKKIGINFRPFTSQSLDS